MAWTCRSRRSASQRLATLLIAAALTATAHPLRAQPASDPATAAEPTGQPEPAGPDGRPGAGPLSGFALIRADRQSYDRQLGRVVASGNVEVTLQGWRLLADRIEFSETSRSVAAIGQVRLQKGDQYLQASSLRYSDWEGSGELLDVYGVIDRDTLARDLRGPGAAEPGDSAAPTFACPPLEADPGRRPLVHLVPPGRSPIPTIAAPAGCPGAVAEGHSHSLNESLDAVAMGRGLDPAPARPVTAAPSTGQAVRDVRYQQSLTTSLSVDLSAFVDTTQPESESDGDRGSGDSEFSRSFKAPKGDISRIRFQASRLRLQGDRWNAAEVAFTNDPFTPAASWTIARQVRAELDPASGVTTITARTSRIVLDQKLSVPAMTRATIGDNQQTQLVIKNDNEDRDGLYLGYSLPPISIGRRGSLELQPQFMLQRAFEGETSSYIEPGASLSSSTITQDITPGDLFGLDAALKLPVAGMKFRTDLSLSTLNPENIPDGTRTRATLSRPLGLSWAPGTTASLFAGYRERVFNGSLGEQNLIYRYGASLSGGKSIPLASGDRETGERLPSFAPLGLNWDLESGNYQANRFESNELDTLWRTSLNLGAGTTLQLWRGKAAYVGEGTAGLRYSPEPVIPGFGLEMGVSGNLISYSNGASQNTLTISGGPALTLGQFDKPWFDYTRLSVSVGGSLLDGGSPFGFDRAVDLRTLSFRAAQQIYGPVVVEGGASFNIDPDSEFYGDNSYSYVEVKLQRRSYEIGIYYSPYDGIGGIRLKLNDFDFTGTGTPFVPRPSSDPFLRRPGT